MDRVARVLAGDRLALARLLTQIENEDGQGLEALSRLYPRTGQAHLIGITGASGTGKSTLVNRLALYLRQRPGAGGQPPKVAIVAVDPSSPFSGGAILGDRIRMRDLTGDPGVFIRSMASRGALGGLARGTLGVVEALDGAGFEVILIETVGAGQTEVDIARLAHTTVVVDAPGMGDDVQAIKAGMLEIADILVVNKADLPGADQTLQLLRATLDAFRPAAEPGAAGWKVPVLATSALRGDGVADLAAALESHRGFLSASGDLARRQRERVRHELEELLRERLAARWLADQPDGRFEAVLEKVVAREISPRQAVSALIEGREP
ncbi:MAG: methylmalonyl Co-A mutase-associated GTPase MeaB [Chloroflexota bacterium]